MAYVLLMILLGLLLSCDIEPPPSDSQTIPTPASLATAATTSASDPMLPREFTLPLPLFAADSAWNQTVTAASVLSENDEQILVTYRVLRGDNSDLHPPGLEPIPWPFMYLNHEEYAIPVFGAGQGQQSVLVCDYEGNLWWPSPKFGIDQQGGPVPVPAPAGTVRPAGPEDIDADGHLVLYGSDTFTAFDFWQATTVRDGECQSRGGGLTGTTIFEAGAIDFFDVRGPGVNPDTYSSARAVGTPLLAGLLLPEDVENGSIAHALAFAIPGLRNMSADPYEPLPSDYFYPASTTETDFFNTNPHALAAGQRLRLKQALVDEQGDPLDENQLAPITRMFLTALRTYGAYVVDNSGGFTFYAEDIHTAVLDLTDAEVNALIAEPPDRPLPTEETKWQIVIRTLNEELEQIPFAYGPWPQGQDPADAEIDTANFEVVEPATLPITVTSTIYLPLALRNFSSLPGLAEPKNLEDVTYWAYQLQDISAPGTVDVLVTSHYDMLVLEPNRTDWPDNQSFDTRGMLTRLKHSPASDGLHRKLIIAYIDVGEAEDWRWYWTWSRDWDCTGDPPDDWPDFILTCDPDGWSGNYPVAYWDPAWKDIIIYGQDSDPARDYNSAIDEAIRDGFDGIYLDWVEAFEDDEVAAAARAAGLDPAAEMITFIQEMRDYANPRNPDFVIIQQNAASLIDGRPELVNVIDAISQEAIWYDGEADVDWEDPTGYDWANDASLVNYYLNHLDQYLSAGLPVFDCEYALDYANTAYTSALHHGYVPYVTRRALSRLTTTPPPGY
jgi:cysteinyl-tRNA synthetase